MNTQHQIYRHPTRREAQAYQRGTYLRFALLFIVIVASMVWNLVFAQTTWTFCAEENTTCTFTGTKQVRYGEPFNNRWSPTRTMTSPVSCNNTTFAPDPSPGTGKRCEIMDVASTPTPTPTPPVNSGWDTKMTVSWVAPTTNTDGSPVCGPLSYKVKLNGNVTATTSALSYQFVGLLAGDYSVSVSAVGSCGESADSTVATAKVTTNPPSCYGKIASNGTDVGTVESIKYNNVGWATLWLCPNPDGSWSYAGLMGHWSDMDADWGKQLGEADTKAKKDALWKARVGYKPQSYYDDVRPLFEQMKAATPLPGAELWLVAKNSTYTSRPAVAVVNGTRTTTQVGKVLVGAKCDCKEHKSVSGSYTYCAVTGQANVATAAVDYLPSSAAICTKQ